MFRIRTPRLGATLVLATALILAAACGDDNGTGSNNNSDSIVASWQVTSFGDGTTDLIASGMTLKITLKSDDTYSFAVTGDLADICGGTSTSCTTTGAYSHTSNQVTIDSGTSDATTFSYAIAGNTMTWTGTIETTAVTIVMTKTS